MFYLDVKVLLNFFCHDPLGNAALPEVLVAGLDITCGFKRNNENAEC